MVNPVIDWHQKNGGHFGNPKAHALRTFREMVEFVLAFGATRWEVEEIVDEEIQKTWRRGSLGVRHPKVDIQDEFADVLICLELQRYYEQIDQDEVVGRKIDTLIKRKWRVDSDGVLWKPVGK